MRGPSLPRKHRLPYDTRSRHHLNVTLYGGAAEVPESDPEIRKKN